MTPKWKIALRFAGETFALLALFVLLFVGCPLLEGQDVVVFNGQKYAKPSLPFIGIQIAGAAPGQFLSVDPLGYIYGAVAPGLAPAYGAGVMNLRATVAANEAANRANFTDGGVYYRAAPGYIDPFISDTSLAMLATPENFSSSDVLSTISHFVAARSTIATYPNVPSGSIPILLAPDGTTNGTIVGVPFCAGFDLWCHHPSAEGIFSLVHLEYLYYQKTGSIARFISDSSIIHAAMQAIPVNSTTRLPTVVAGSEWVCFGFQESIRFTGDLGTCSMQMYQTAIEIATMAGLAGNPTLMATYNTMAANIKASLGVASPLWDTVNGMFLGATGQDKQIDTTASVLAIQYGIATPAQATAISNYMATNAATLFFQGYLRQSNVDFAVVGGLDTGGPPYNTASGLNNAYCYQRGGYWSHVNRAAMEALNYANPAAAIAQMVAMQNTFDPTYEYLAPGCYAPLGFRQNLESGAGNVYAANEISGLATSPGVLQGVYAKVIGTSDAEMGVVQNKNTAGYSSLSFVDAATQILASGTSLPSLSAAAGIGWGNSASNALLRNKAYFFGNNAPICLSTTLSICDISIDTSHVATLNQVNHSLLPLGSVGAVASAATVAPTTPFVLFSGTTGITTITPPSGTGATVGAVFDWRTASALTFGTGGNIGSPALTTVAGQAGRCFYAGSNDGKWYCK